MRERSYISKCLMVVLGCWALLSVKATEYQFKHYDTSNGLSQNTVLVIAQDSTGFMWFGTNGGLNRFDGKTFKVYRKSQGPHGIAGDRIEVIYEARDHRLWIGTEHGVYIYSPTTDSFSEFDVQTADGEHVGSHVNVITGDGDRILIGCIGQGIFVYDMVANTLVHHPLPDYPSVSSIVVDESRTIWLGFYEGGLCYTRNDFRNIVDFKDPDGHKVLDRQTITGIIPDERGHLYLCSSAMGLSELDIYNKVLTSLISTADGKSIYAHHIIRNDNELLMATESGLFVYDLSRRRYQHYKYEPTNPFSLSDNSLQTVFRDKNGDIWVGSYFGGVCYSPRMSYAFSNYIPRIDVPGSLHGRRVRQMVEDPDGRIWIGTEDGGLNRLSPQTGQFAYVEASADFPNVQSLCLVGGELWVGTFAGGVKVLDAATGRLLRSYSADGQPGSLRDNTVFSLCLTHDGQLCLGTLGGLFYYDAASDSFNSVSELPQQIVYDMLEDSHHNLWVAVYDHGIYMRPSGSSSWQCFRSADSTLTGDNVVSLFETSQGVIWATTDGNGVSSYDAQAHRFVQQSIPSYHPQRVVLDMVEDGEGLLWMTTNEGLLCYNPENAAPRMFTTANGLLDNNFSYSSALRSSTGRIYLGCKSGLVAFSTESFLALTASPTIVATELVIQGRVVDNFTEESPLMQSITSTRELTLRHDQNSLALKIAVLSYRDAQVRQINYILEGFDHEWQYLYNDNYIRYTNLPPGHYVLRVQDMTTSGKVAEQYVLNITILRPWYSRWWAWLLWAVLGAGCFVLVYHYLTQRSRLNRRLAMEKFEHEKEQELYHSKISFFTNVAHEIRTPLTLIKGPLTDILQRGVKDEEERENLHIMDQNVTRLLDLTNQLLDFRKTERNGLRLNFQHCNINQLVSDVNVRFKPLMQNRGIENHLQLPEEPLQAWVDREAFTKIVSNLLSNATKYCDHLVQVSLHLTDDNQLLLETVNDGDLIAPEVRQKIFTPFYRADSAEAQTGTGIGLALARSLAELHGGQLTIVDDSSLNIFRLTLPVEHGEHVIHPLSEDALPDDDEAPESPDELEAEVDEQLPAVLIVEDNAALLSYEKNHLARHYRVFCADNGEQALQVLQSHEVDIIVSDVMMEPIDGFELCQRVKTDVTTSHIPFILLTALTLDSAKVQGMESGADSYIEKPFSMDYLFSVIENLLRSRQSIKQAYATSPFLQQETVSISKADEAFMQRLEKVMADNLSDSDFDINAMASQMFMSRTNLNRKMRGLFNLTPNNYIKVERLKRAAHLLKQGDTKVNEVCYRVGFSSPSYFTQCFQKQFGLLPKDFISQQNA